MFINASNWLPNRLHTKKKHDFNDDHDETIMIKIKMMYMYF